MSEWPSGTTSFSRSEAGLKYRCNVIIEPSSILLNMHFPASRFNRGLVLSRLKSAYNALHLDLMGNHYTPQSSVGLYGLQSPPRFTWSLYWAPLSTPGSGNRELETALLQVNAVCWTAPSDALHEIYPGSCMDHAPPSQSQKGLEVQLQISNNVCPISWTKIEIW